ncbi:hypothetical protein ACWD01_29000, partial [Streptomyces sp. NPDC002835]
PKMDGVSTYLALIFGTLLSSQGTDASFVLTLRSPCGLSSGRFPSVLRFQLYQIRFPFRFRLEFISGGRWGPFGLSADPTLSEAFRPT